MKAYFRVSEPFRIYLKRGWCWTNSYVGASRVGASVYDALNAQLGDEIHCLPGGTFIARASGESAEVRLSAPKPFFEKTYLHFSDTEILRKNTRVAEIEAPSRSIDYGAVRQLGDKQFSEYSREVREVEPSPEMVTLTKAALLAFEAVDTARNEGVVDDLGNPPSIRSSDISADRPVVSLKAYCGSYSKVLGRNDPVATYSLEYAYIPKFATLIVPENEAVAGHQPERVEGRRAYYRMQLDEAAGHFGCLLSDRLGAMADSKPRTTP